VLITGEAGSGRETFARYLHSQSARRDRPFVDLGVSAIARNNAARELFGSEEEGHIHYGSLEQAAGGTLLLEEVADMDVEIQSQLLGALDTGSFLRVGGSEPVRIDVRIIAATQRNLEEEVRAERFREDLFYHLNVVPLHVPALREHNEDIPELLSYYVDYFATHEKLPYRRFSVGAQNYMRNYSWPGNVRELKNLVQRVLILGAGDEITQDEVETALGAPPRGTHPVPGGDGFLRSAIAAGPRAVREGIPRVPTGKARRQRQQDGQGGRDGAHAPLPKAALAGDRDQGKALAASSVIAINKEKSASFRMKRSRRKHRRRLVAGG
jgi:DNA-binding NtrC family response regulator